MFKRTQSTSTRWGAFCLYVALSIILFGRDTRLSTDVFSGGTGDALSFIWCLAWWPFAIAHGLNPLFTHLVWFPLGYPMTWATSIPAAALLAAPVTYVFGALTSFNILMVTSPAIAAFFAMRCCLRLTSDRAAALLGGALFGFSPYETATLQGHINLCLIWPIPAMILTIQLRSCQYLRHLWFAVGLALLLVAEFGISAEVFASLAVFGSIALAIAFVLGSRSNVLHLAREIGGAFAIAILGLMPWLLAMWHAAPLISGFVNPPELYSTDIANLVIPTDLTWIHAHLGGLPAGFTGNGAEQAGYVGVIILALSTFIAWDLREEWFVRCLVAFAIVVVVLSMGPQLWVGGLRSGFPMPWKLAERLPLLRGALPSRFMVYADLAISFLVALWVAKGRSLPRRWRIGCASLGLVTWLPNPSSVVWSPAPSDPFFEPRHVERVLGKDANVIVLPYDSLGPSMAWQWQSGFRFSQTGGYLSFVPKPYNTLMVLSLMTGRVESEFAKHFTEYCKVNKVGFVLIGPGAPPTLQAAMESLSWARHQDGDIVVMEAPQP